MPPRRINDNFIDDSDSDVSILGDFEQGARAKAKGKGKAVDKGKPPKAKSKAKEQPYAWEASYTRSWDTVQEDETGSLQTSVEDLIARGRRRRSCSCHPSDHHPPFGVDTRPLDVHDRP